MTVKYRAVIITDTYVGIPGGSERHLLTYLSNSTDRIQYDVFQLIPTGNPSIQDGHLHGRTHVRFWSRPIRKVASLSFIALFFQLLYLCVFKQVRLVVCYHEKSEILGYVLKRLMGKRLVVICSKRDMGFKLSGRLERLIKKIAPSWDMVTCPSVAIKQWLIDDYNVPSDRVQVVYNGVDEHPFISVDQNAVSDLRSKLNLGSASVVLNIGCLKPVKGHRDLINAFSDLCKMSMNKPVLLLLGEGPCEAELKEQVHQLGLQKNVLFLGYQSNIPEWMSLADLVVSSSLSEGLSNALVEACAAGKPIVATDVGGNSEVVEDGLNGKLVASGDVRALANAMQSLIQDNLLARDMGARGRERAQMLFSGAVMAETLESHYRDIISKAQGGKAPLNEVSSRI